VSDAAGAGFWGRVMSCADERGFPHPGCAEHCGARDLPGCPLMKRYGAAPARSDYDGPMAEALRRWKGE
jgi:hypothetical protein